MARAYHYGERDQGAYTAQPCVWQIASPSPAVGPCKKCLRAKQDIIFSNKAIHDAIAKLGEGNLASGRAIHFRLQAEQYKLASRKVNT